MLRPSPTKLLTQSLVGPLPAVWAQPQALVASRWATNRSTGLALVAMPTLFKNVLLKRLTGPCVCIAAAES